MKTPYANDSKPEQGQLVELPRLTVYYETMGAGEPLLLLRGYGGCCKNWHPFAETLVGQAKPLIHLKTNWTMQHIDGYWRRNYRKS